MANSMPPPSGSDALVVGAGIVGVCCALYLQRDGFKVTLIDRDGPGEAASFGNAGSLGVASVPPLGMPGIARKAPKMVFDPMHPLVVRLRHLPGLLPWFARFIAASQPQRVEEIADARAALLARVYDAYDPLLEAAGARDLIRNAGLLFVFESDAAMADAAFAIDMRRKRGVALEELTGEEVRAREPALGPLVACGVYFPEVSYAVDPLRLTQKLARHFVSRGGGLLRETVKGFEIGTGGRTRVVTDAGLHDVGVVVVAAGAWSASLAGQLGSRVLLAAERGYHTVLPDPRVEMRIPVTSGDRNVTITPMETGVRMTTMAEFAAVDAPPDYARPERLFRAARALVPGLNAEGGTRWMGPRPSTPDSLPVIGPSPRHPNVYFAFGHGHLGLTFAAVTGRYIADMASGRTPNMDLRPYRADRF